MKRLQGTIAGRLWQSKLAIDRAFAPHELVWMLASDKEGPFDGPIGFPDTLGALVEEVGIRHEDLDDGSRWKEGGYVTIGDGTLLADVGTPSTVNFSSGAGRFDTMDNSFGLGFRGTAPIGEPEVLRELFSDIVRIWQPDYGTLATLACNRSRRGTYQSPRPGYLSWVSSLAFKTPEPTPFATATAFGDGTLLVMHDWSVESYGEFYDALETQGVLTVMPQTQVVPSFPSS